MRRRAHLAAIVSQYRRLGHLAARRARMLPGPGECSTLPYRPSTSLPPARLETRERPHSLKHARREQLRRRAPRRPAAWTLRCAVFRPRAPSSTTATTTADRAALCPLPFSRRSVQQRILPSPPRTARRACCSVLACPHAVDI